MALIVTRRELRDSLRDWRIVWPIVILTLVFPWIMNFTARVSTSFVEKYGASPIGPRLIPFLLMIKAMASELCPLRSLSEMTDTGLPHSSTIFR